MELENTYMTINGPDSSIILRYIRNTASEEEKVQVDIWLKDNPEHEKVLLQIARIYYANRTHERIASRDSLRAYQDVQKKMQVHARRFLLKRVSVYAACFLVGLIISSVIYWKRQDSVLLTPQMVTIQANAGIRTHFNLPDGTVAYLNSGSTLSYSLPYDKNVRRVNLSGEAYFEVTHNPEQPFVVSVHNDRMRVKVHGTEFNVQAYEEESQIQTTLVSGSVDIEVVRSGQITRKAHLKPSDKAVYDVAKDKINIFPVNTEYETSWIDGRLVFKNMPLPQVLKKLSYFYNVKFDVQDDIINSYYFTGTFQDKQLSQVLDYLKITSQIDYEIKTTRSDDSHKIQQSVVVLKN
ncbi:FecR domain-containing protein [uncultured Parabacteroides sp.]|uniref:FecR family protein n=1 Tax=uncultured Parabacteroides sp. TaxID=512312 RepID=UPI0025F1A527|nr:FecR domain-containing protein [uncultured Parabacteroides sp.]